MFSYSMIRKTTFLAAFLALFVVMLGAYTRLTNAGLGCPDWPGCYGHMVLPSTDKSLQQAQGTYPEIPIESKKAWTEMAHRYAAGSLALLILFIGFATLKGLIQGQKLPWHLPTFLFILVIFQAALGMWTVTLKLLPVVVMSHLLGGMTIFACLSRFYFQLSPYQGQNIPTARPWIRVGFIILLCQIALGGWVSSNYAGISCIGFPTCNGLWIPTLHLSKGFNLFSMLGPNYQGGVLDNEVRVTIQFIHRLGAVVTALYLLCLCFFILKKIKLTALKITASLCILLVLTQFSLGVMNVVYLLPLPIATAHNGVAALLLATLLCMLHFTQGDKSHAF